jgi:hypothetical protein
METQTVDHCILLKIIDAAEAVEEIGEVESRSVRYLIHIGVRVQSVGSQASE